MGHRAWGIGHGALGIGHGALGIGHGARLRQQERYGQGFANLKVWALIPQNSFSPKIITQHSCNLWQDQNQPSSKSSAFLPPILYKSHAENNT
ncbi:hypothetical protein [Microcoleus sp. FACHB-68]|uniref:hypothetical protein n=1 Tax=Microcoleus sp. FACHB-68 TaxID=2692826 RepID=UPI0016853AF1|nr:hypothetical protein [Microcoleus sp. FACHB-68]MBD1938288.1 hypothetical protein [Microcoleus sp. FACHB-68]